MHFKERTQVKVELLLRLQDSKGVFEKTGVELEPGRSTDNLSITDSDKGIQQKVNVLKVFNEQTNAKDIYNYLSDPAGTVVNTLLKGFNVTLLTYSQSGTGKTHSMFGTDSSFNETRTGFNVLNSVYNEVKKNAGHLGIGINAIEIKYDDERDSEMIKDLLDVTGSHENTSLDFSGFTTVAIKSTIELENVLNIARRRSKSWSAVYDKEKENYNVEYRPNSSHMIFRLCFTDIQEKKQFSFCLLDLIGIDNTRKDSLEQLSLTHVHKFFDELYSVKERIEHYKADQYKNMKFKNTKTGEFSALSAHTMKIVTFLSQLLLISQTLIFTPISPAFETSEELLAIFERLIKLNTIRYSIDRDNINITKKINIMSFPAFSRAVQSYLETYEDTNFKNKSANPISTPNVVQSMDFTKKPTYTSSPLKNKTVGEPEQTSSGKKKARFAEEYTQKDAGRHSPQPLKESSSYNRIKNEYEQSVKRIDDLNNQVAYLKSPNSAGKLQTADNETLEFNSQDFEQRLASQSNYQSRTQGYSSPNAYSSGSTRAGYLSNNADQQRVITEQPRPQPRNENFMEDYADRAKNAKRVLENFNLALRASPHPQNIQSDYAILKKNYLALYELFIEGEEVREQLLENFADVGKKIQEFKTEYDIKINDSQLENIKLQSEIRLLKESKDVKELFQHYEKEITALMAKNTELREDNSRLSIELGTSFREQIDRVEGMEHAQANLLKKRINEFMRKYEKMAKTNQQYEEELQSFKKRERLLNLDKRMLDNMHSKNVSMSKKLENKEEATRAFTEQIKHSDKEVKTLKQQLHEREEENKKLSKEYFVAIEQLTLYKEMMKKENANVFLDTFMQSKQSSTRRSPKKMGELDSLGSKLRSLNY